MEQYFFNELMKILNETKSWNVVYYKNGERQSPEKVNDMTQNIAVLEKQLKDALRSEDYLLAAKLRDQLKDVKENYLTYEKELNELQIQKTDAVKKEDYELANELNEKMKVIQDKMKG